MLRTIFTSITIVLFLSTNSQSDIKMSNFFLTPISYNPAYAGSSDGISLTSIYSTQWLGFEGAPKTLFVNGHGSFLSSKTGLGLELMHDEIGVTTDTRVLANFAYHINLTKKWRFSMGIKAGGSWYAVDYSRLSIENPTEVNGVYRDVTINSYQIGTGFYLHHDNFFFGVGIPNLLKTTYYDAYKNVLANASPNYYLSTGYKFDLRDDWYFQPMLLTRITKGAPINTLIAGTLNWDERFYTSLNMDLKSTIGGFLGIRINKQFLVGYSYDTSINTFSAENGGIHTFFLNFKLDDYWQRKRCGCYSF